MSSNNNNLIPGKENKLYSQYLKLINQVPNAEQFMWPTLMETNLNEMMSKKEYNRQQLLHMIGMVEDVLKSDTTESREPLFSNGPKNTAFHHLQMMLLVVQHNQSVLHENTDINLPQEFMSRIESMEKKRTYNAASLGYLQRHVHKIIDAQYDRILNDGTYNGTVVSLLTTQKKKKNTVVKKKTAAAATKKKTITYTVETGKENRKYVIIKNKRVYID